MQRGSILYFVSVFMCVDPNTVYCPLAFVLRGQTPWMPAHVDPDEPGLPVPHLYLRGLMAAPALGRAGNRLVVFSERDGGQAVTHATEPCVGEVDVVTFTPTDMLHMVDSAGEEEHAIVDDTQVRVIPFNCKWIADMLLSSGSGAGGQREGEVGIRLAPLHPCVREPITCTQCAHMFGSPHANPVTWMNHMGWHMAHAKGGAFVCFDCMWEEVTGEDSYVFYHSVDELLRDV